MLPKLDGELVRISRLYVIVHIRFVREMSAWYAFTDISRFDLTNWVEVVELDRIVLRNVGRVISEVNRTKKHEVSQTKREDE